MTRLEPAPTQRIDRNKELRFSWQGRPMRGLAGDSLATALLANGVRIFGRSLKYHRPRGLYSLDGESANTLVAVDGECNVRAETTLLREGMAVTAQNSSGPVERDRLAFLDKLDGFMPAGFYYRRFHKPAAVWPLAIKWIRKLAGTVEVRNLGRLVHLLPDAMPRQLPDHAVAPPLHIFLNRLRDLLQPIAGLHLS